MSLSKPYLVCEELKRRIINGHYSAGSKLSENMIASEFDVGKTPAREALVLLTREGYVTCKPRSGYYVVPIQREEQLNIREARYAIESSAVRIILSKCAKEEIEGLYKLIELSSTDDEYYSRENYYFHARLGELTHNQILSRTIAELAGKSLLPAEESTGASEEPWKNYHRLICDALVNSDADAAVHYLKCDILGESFSYLK